MARIVSVAAAIFICLAMVIYAYKLVAASNRQKKPDDSYVPPVFVSDTAEPAVTAVPDETQPPDTPAQTAPPLVTTAPPKTQGEGKVTFYIDPKTTVDSSAEIPGQTTKDPFVVDWKG